MQATTKRSLSTCSPSPLIRGEEEEEFHGGLQDRFQVVGMSPFSLEEAALVTILVEVSTTEGDAEAEVEIHTHLPWKSASGIRNVAIGQAVLLHGKDQASYNWSLTRPSGSAAALTDVTSQSPYFTPDIAGTYQVTVTDQAADETVTLEIYAGTWEGIIGGQDEDGRPVVENGCTVCHSSTHRSLGPERARRDLHQTAGHEHPLRRELPLLPHGGLRPGCG